MTIDIHRHLVAKEWYSKYFGDRYARMVQRAALEMGCSKSV